MRFKLAAALAMILSSPAHAEWQKATSAHFVVYSDDKAENVADYARKLERFDKAFRELRVYSDIPRGPASRVTVFLVKNLGEIQKLAGNNRVAGFYQARAGNSVAFVPRSSGDSTLTSQAIFFHEYTHHLMLTQWADAGLPAWYVEGFAEFHATAIFKDNGNIIFGAVPEYRKYTVANANLVPIQKLLQTTPGKIDDYQTDALYSRGWLLTHYLTFDPDRRAQLGKYVVAINNGKSVAEAGSVFGDISGLDLKLNSYLKRRFLPSIEIRSDQIVIGKVDVAPVSAGEAATLPVLMISTNGVDEKSAPGVADTARKLATPFPNDAAAQNVLAEAAYDAKRYAEAEAAADRALAADPKSVHALIYKGLAQSAVAKDAKIETPATWQAIRKWFIAANKADTEDPRPLIEYFDSFENAKVTPTKSADEGLLYAYALAPHDPDLRFRVAKVLIRQNRLPAAKSALAPVAFNAHTGSFAKVLAEMMAALDKGDGAGAISIYEAGKKEAEEKAKRKGKG
jgi:tetratricopeptide (TPR) repeat protein